MFLPRLSEAVSAAAPGIDIGLRQVLPPQGAKSDEQTWASALAALEAREMDLAVVPLGAVPARFEAKALF